MRRDEPIAVAPKRQYAPPWFLDDAMSPTTDQYRIEKFEFRWLRSRMSGTPTAAPILEERRRHPRYAIRLDVHYKLRGIGDIDQTGTGRTINISTGGVLLESDRPLLRRKQIALDILWPVLLDGTRHLKYVVHGRVVRSEGNTVAVRVRSSEFRTRRTK